jgi:hypothetical protein
LTVERFTGPVWEPACGDGAISAVLAGTGLDVVSTDLVDRGYGDGGFDFLACKDLAAPEVVTNPPYKLAEKFLHHALDLGARKVAFLLRLAWLEGERRRGTVYSRRPPARVWVMSARPTLWSGSDPNPRDTGGAMAYAWFVWDTAVVDRQTTTLGWLARQ